MTTKPPTCHSCVLKPTWQSLFDPPWTNNGSQPILNDVISWSKHEMVMIHFQHRDGKTPFFNFFSDVLRMWSHGMLWTDIYNIYRYSSYSHLEFWLILTLLAVSATVLTSERWRWAPENRWYRSVEAEGFTGVTLGFDMSISSTARLVLMCVKCCWVVDPHMKYHDIIIFRTCGTSFLEAYLDQKASAGIGSKPGISQMTIWPLAVTSHYSNLKKIEAWLTKKCSRTLLMSIFFGDLEPHKDSLDAIFRSLITKPEELSSGFQEWFDQKWSRGGWRSFSTMKQ